MRNARAKKVFRVAAVLLALIGFVNLRVAIPFDLKSGAFGAIFSSMFALLGAYVLYVAYLCWWRLSPCAVRHACLVGAFYVFGGVGLLLDRVEAVTSAQVHGALALVAFIAIVWTYVRVSRHMTRLVFGEQPLQNANQ